MNFYAEMIHIKKRDLDNWDFEDDNDNADEINDELENADYVIHIGFFNKENHSKVFFFSNENVDNIIEYFKVAIKQLKRMLKDIKYMKKNRNKRRA